MAKVGETFQNLHEGMNGGLYPAYISALQYAKGINVTCRGGVIRTRPPFNEIGVTSTDQAMTHNLRHGKFQGMFTYHYQDTEYIAFGMSGRVYLLNPVTQIITDLSAVPGPMTPTVHRLYFCQAEDYLVVQDGVLRPLIALNTVAAFAAGNQVPTGTIMAYGQGRLFVKTGIRQFRAGDINLPNTPVNVLNFIENQYLAGGGAFFTPTGMGDITGMTFVQQFGTATGLGPLVVFCKEGICSFDVSTPRLQWQDLSIMRIEAGGNGNVSHLGVVKLDDDMVFRTWGGISDFSLMISQQQNRQRITNLNMEVLPFVDNEDSAMLPFVSAAKFNNRVLYTIQGETVNSQIPDGQGGYDTTEDYRFQGLISLDFAPMDGISTLGQVVKPSYDGVWTGCYPMGICSGIFNYTERCFVWGKDNDGVNHLFEIGDYPGDDTLVEPQTAVAINCRLYTRMTPFVIFTGNRPSQIPQEIKTLQDAWIWLSEIRDRVRFQLYVRADRCFDFHKLSEFCMNAPLVSLGGTAGNVQASAKTKWPELGAQGCQQINGRVAEVGFEFEFCIEFDGQTEINRMLFNADAKAEDRSIPCECAGEVLIGTERSDYDYSIYAGGVVGGGFHAQGDTETSSGGGANPPAPGPSAPITGGTGTQTDPYTMTGQYCTKFSAMDAATAAGAAVGTYIKPQWVGSSGNLVFPIETSGTQFLTPITSGLGTVGSPFILSGTYTSYHAANDLASINYRWPTCPAPLSLTDSAQGDSFVGAYLKAQIYDVLGVLAWKTFIGWSQNFGFTPGPGFHPGEGSGTVGDPYLLKADGGSPLYDFPTLSSAQFWIQRCWADITYFGNWSKIGQYFRLKIATIQTDVQVP